jgi:hypothetical protein
VCKVLGLATSEIPMSSVGFGYRWMPVSVGQFGYRCDSVALGYGWVTVVQCHT